LTSDPHMEPAGGSALAGSEMATLLEEGHDFRSPQRGEIVEGTVMGWDREGVLIDIGAKSEGVVPRNEMQSLGSEAETRLQAGDKVLVCIVQPDTADGQIVLSVDRARGEQGWHVLQERFESGETFEGEVTGYNRGGLLVNVEGVNAFVPLSQLTGVRPDRGDDGGSNSLAEAVGRKLRLKVIEINRRRNRVILSERAALQEWRTAQKERLIQELREGDIRRGRVTSVRSFGVFVDLGGADGLAHLSELTWERDKQPSDLFKVGDEVDVYVTKIDTENKKIALSLRRARPEQWDAVVGKYREGQVVPGLVTKLVPFGAFARIEGPVEGLIHVSELVDRRIGHPKEVVREGDLLPLKIVRIERDRHRLGLSLRRARDEGEGIGFVFSEGGEVLQVPEDIRSEFEAREGPIEVPAPSFDDEPRAEAPAEPPEELRAEAPAEPSDEPRAEAPAEPPEEPSGAPVAEATTAPDEAQGLPEGAAELSTNGSAEAAPPGPPEAVLEEPAAQAVEPSGDETPEAGTTAEEPVLEEASTETPAEEQASEEPAAAEASVLAGSEEENPTPTA
jgi:small subunit ribosomal protein S1